MFIDSHCHLNFPELVQRLPEILQNMQNNQIDLALAISVSRSTFEEVLEIASQNDNIYATVGIHPDDPEAAEFTFDELVEHGKHPKVVGIGETGLDYHWCEGDMTWQHERFITHIQASNQTKLPVIVHTRKAADDTMRLLREYKAEQGVIHCFTENKEVARQALDLGFYISFSGIVTFKNAKEIQETAQYVPLDRILIETDAPFLAPVPFRGKTNEPAFVSHVAEYIAKLRECSVEEVGQATSENFYRLFNKVKSPSI